MDKSRERAINAETGEQITAYSFGVTVAGGSTINSNDVLRVTTMPDGGATVKEVNRQGEAILVTDARGVVRQLLRDLLGRALLDAVLTLPDGVDGAVMAIGLTYEVRGLVEKITSYAAASGPGSTVVNEVQNLYNDFWQLYQQFQEHSGAVNTTTSKSVQYAYADGTGNSSRPTGVTYPSTAALNLGYGASGSPDDLLSRVSSLLLGTDTVASYNFLGVGTPVIAEYPDPDIAYTLATGSGAGLYAGLDIFGRVINCLWQQTVGGTTTALASLGYGYDFASNRQWREDKVSKALSSPKYFDEFYGLDGVYRVTGLARGQLTGTPPTGVTGQTFGEDWTLDPTGNWNEYQQLSDASTVTLDQTRTASAVNEITALTNSTGDAWAQPGYDAAGNMTTMPQPNSPGNPYASTFDAWQRMRFLYDMTTGSPVQVQENQYDGRNFRVRRIIPTESGTETRDFYHSDSWQVLQEYVAGYVDRQYVWGLRYIDDLILRDRSVSSPGALDERHYALQDDNWNVVAIYNAGTSAIDQRFAYSAYGILLPLNPDFTAYTSGGYDWTVLYTGRELDVASGLMYYRMRYYHPALGVFLSRDPILFRAGVNLSEYAYDAPTNRTDWLGLQPWMPPALNPPGWGPFQPRQMPMTPSMPATSNFKQTPAMPVPEDSWTPDVFFGDVDDLIEQTRFGCGGLAAWRCGLTPTKEDNKLFPWGIDKIPGAAAYGSWDKAVAALKAQCKCKGGLIVAMEISSGDSFTDLTKPGAPAWDVKDMNGQPASALGGVAPYNFATLLGTAEDPFWEFADHSWDPAMGHGTAGSHVIHSRKLPLRQGGHVAYVVVPGCTTRFASPVPSDRAYSPIKVVPPPAPPSPPPAPTQQAPPCEMPNCRDYVEHGL